MELYPCFIKTIIKQKIKYGDFNDYIVELDTGEEINLFLDKLLKNNPYTYVIYSSTTIYNKYNDIIYYLCFFEPTTEQLHTFEYGLTYKDHSIYTKVEGITTYYDSIWNFISACIMKSATIDIITLYLLKPYRFHTSIWTERQLANVSISEDFIKRLPCFKNKVEMEPKLREQQDLYIIRTTSKKVTTNEGASWVLHSYAWGLSFINKEDTISTVYCLQTVDGFCSLEQEKYYPTIGQYLYAMVTPLGYQLNAYHSHHPNDWNKDQLALVEFKKGKYKFRREVNAIVAIDPLRNRLLYKSAVSTDPRKVITLANSNFIIKDDKVLNNIASFLGKNNRRSKHKLKKGKLKKRKSSKK